MSAPTGDDLRAAIASEYVALADALVACSESQWDTPSLCAGWRVREVVAHVTMPSRYSPEAFIAELEMCGGDFTRLSNTVASRDGQLPVTELVGQLRDEQLHRWIPPGGGDIGALSHVVIHGLDVLRPLGIARRAPAESLRPVLDALAGGGGHAHFGVGLDGVHLAADDLSWEFGAGVPQQGTAAELVLWLSGRGAISTAVLDREDVRTRAVTFGELDRSRR